MLAGVLPGSVVGQRKIGRVMVFVLDNYDSFTYNLVQYMGELVAECDYRCFGCRVIPPARKDGNRSGWYRVNTGSSLDPRGFGG
jgi:hypothetical protein